ncbi:hypothetical protein BC939DRAFT_439629 [Gamsiella multidivaricata]|uniref:uncharacterized protein n=1 Tax=Gamsiella multidivaricata TaxID=101098 RepID=UPI00221FC695|nr:uncharacterized protein BC939DRAFT_439629 [Gamsiella multidivaricata]KAI7830525.1 hypothetical protein BC939DRAFT_439629 [Gamsiella multidivaricata]
MSSVLTYSFLFSHFLFLTSSSTLVHCNGACKVQRERGTKKKRMHCARQSLECLRLSKGASRYLVSSVIESPKDRITQGFKMLLVIGRQKGENDDDGNNKEEEIDERDRGEGRRRRQLMFRNNGYCQRHDRISKEAEENSSAEE